MPLTTQDFDIGVDFTGLPNVTAGDLNNGVNLAQPHQENASEGKGIILYTVDIAVGVPDVPDATTHIKWRKYLWIRVPDPGDTVRAAILYSWNDASIVDFTYQKWQPVETDLTAINTALAAVQGLATTAYNQSTQAINLAQTVNTIANNAQVAAGNAVTTATSASATAAAAQGVANTANAASIAATANANAATASAAAVTTALSNYQLVNHSCYLQETTGVGVDGAALVAGKNTRIINSEQSDIFNLVTLAGGKIIITNAGTYEFEIETACCTFNNRIQAFLVKDSDNSVLIHGTDATTFNAADITNLTSYIKGICVIAAAITLRVDMYALSTRGVWGKATSFGAMEVYTNVKIRQIA